MRSGQSRRLAHISALPREIFSPPRSAPACVTTYCCRSSESTGWEANAHYSGKREQERLIEQGRVPWTIVPATQFHDFAALAVSWTERDGVAAVAPPLVQPIAPDDMSLRVLAEVATAEPQGRYVGVAGPEPQDLVDMARRTNDVLGRLLHVAERCPVHQTLGKAWFAPDWSTAAVGTADPARCAPTALKSFSAAAPLKSTRSIVGCASKERSKVVGHHAVRFHRGIQTPDPPARPQRIPHRRHRDHKVSPSAPHKPKRRRTRRSRP